jgi:hypothetical protein
MRVEWTQFVNVLGEVGDHLLPTGSLGGGDPGIVKPSLVYPHERKEALHHFQSSSGIKVSVRVMAVPGMAAGNEYSISPAKQRFHHKEGIHPT